MKFCLKDLQFSISISNLDSPDYTILNNYSSPVQCVERNSSKPQVCSHHATTCRIAGDCCLQSLNKNWPMYFHESENIAHCYNFVSNFDSNNNPEQNISLLVIDKCVNTMSNSLPQCESSDSLESMVIGSDNKLYKNRHCALCNNDQVSIRLPNIRFCSNNEVSIENFQSKCVPILHPLYLALYGDLTIPQSEDVLTKLRKCQNTQTYSNSQNNLQSISNITNEDSLVEFLCLVSEKKTCSVATGQTFKNTFCAILQSGEACNMCEDSVEIDEFMINSPPSQNIFVYNSEQLQRPYNVEEISLCLGQQLLQVALPGENESISYCKIQCHLPTVFSIPFKQCLNPSNILEIEIQHSNKTILLNIAKQIFSEMNLPLDVFDLMQKYNLKDLSDLEYSISIGTDHAVISFNKDPVWISSKYGFWISEMMKYENSVFGHNPGNFSLSISKGPLSLVKNLHLNNELSFSYSTSEIKIVDFSFMFGDSYNSKTKITSFQSCPTVHYYLEDWNKLSSLHQWKKFLENLHPEMIIHVNEYRFDVQLCEPLITLMKKYGNLTETKTGKIHF